MNNYVVRARVDGSATAKSQVARESFTAPDNHTAVRYASAFARATAAFGWNPHWALAVGKKDIYRVEDGDVVLNLAI